MDQSDSVSNAPINVWVCVPVCQMHMCCLGLYDSVSDEPVVV